MIQKKFEENGDREKVCRLYAAIGYRRYENNNNKDIYDLEIVHKELLKLKNRITDVDTYILWNKILDALIKQEPSTDYQSQRDENNQKREELEGKKKR